jgi:glycosyltransferase involved in cell wall biosynthesis
VSTNKFVPRTKENLVTCLGVFNPRKNYETAVTAVAHAASKPTLRIIGSFSPGYFSYPTYLKKLAKELGAADRIHLHVNSSFSELKSVVGRSKICVSCGVEYFGIAIVEQMSAGCVPVVYKSFAPWSDIIEYGKFGFGFRTTTELQELIDELISDPSLCSKMASKAIERAKFFDETIFRKKIADLILDVV